MSWHCFNMSCLRIAPAHAPCPDVSGSNRDAADAEVVRAVSLYADNLTHSGLRHTTKCVFPAVIQNERNGLSETGSSFSGRSTLTVCPRNLWAVSNEPILVSLDDCGELVMHGSRILPDRRASRSEAETHPPTDGEITAEVTRLTVCKRSALYVVGNGRKGPARDIGAEDA